MSYSIRIFRSSGDVEDHPLRDAQVTIGSESPSDLVLKGEPGLLPQHILIAPRGEQCWVSTAPAGAPLLEESGSPVAGGYLPWGARLTLGSTAFELRAGHLKKDRNPERAVADKSTEAGKPVSPLILMLLVIAMIVSGRALLSGGASSAAGLPTEIPALFDEAPSCSSENALHRAALLEEAAFAKSERSVFDLQDGVRAVGLFAEAEACYRNAGNAALAREAAAQGRELRASLSEEYQVSRLRLGRALKHGNRIQVQQELQHLGALLQHRRESDYVRGLRRLALRYASEK